MSSVKTITGVLLGWDSNPWPSSLEYFLDRRPTFNCGTNILSFWRHLSQLGDSMKSWEVCCGGTAPQVSSCTSLYLMIREIVSPCADKVRCPLVFPENSWVCRPGITHRQCRPWPLLPLVLTLVFKNFKRKDPLQNENWLTLSNMKFKAWEWFVILTILYLKAVDTIGNYSK